ncbi:MAG: Na+/H+ antiporter NhaC family protein [Oscillospiraceae bacterium]|nr:Na+/H+ antiporter NhaC family protein [Oscillospiraceae bacterium]
MRSKNRWLSRVAVIMMMVMALATTIFATGEEAEVVSKFINTPWSLLPPVIAIVLALITKEVYSSLFIGILAGGLMYSNFSFEGTLNHVFNDGIVASLSDSWNVGILVFLVILGAMVSLMNKAGGSAAFGRWAQTHIKSRVGAQLASILLGCLIFIDDYFNCLTVGSVMRPVADKHKLSRAKLSYIIDATAAPVCIIAPISSWAAAVAGFAEDGQGFNLFLRAIPYNFYALLTIVMMVGLVVMKVDFGPMAKHERNAIENGDLFSGSNPYANADDDAPEGKGIVLDLVFPVIVLIISCVIGMIYTGGFFSGESFINSFANSDASVGLMLGSAVALVITMIYYMIRRSMKFKEMMSSIPEGFKAMVPAILILTFAWSLKAMTDSLGAKEFVAALVESATGIQFLLPVIVFAVGCVLAFATGTSWGTFGILIPIVQSALPAENPLMIVCISACMAGAVCGDHCSPISDTTIMASAGAQCDHVNHVSTQLPYAFSCAVIAGIAYLVAGVLGMVGAPVIIALPVGLVLMLGFLLIMKRDQKK